MPGGRALGCLVLVSHMSAPMCPSVGGVMSNRPTWSISQCDETFARSWIYIHLTGWSEVVRLAWSAALISWLSMSIDRHSCMTMER